MASKDVGIILTNFNASCITNITAAPPDFRLRAIARMPIVGNSAKDISLPFHQNTRLRISITTIEDSWTTSCFFASPRPDGRASDPEIVLKTAQTEIIDQEIFSLLVKEAGNLPTASARVSERLIAIDAAQGLDLIFELVEYPLYVCCYLTT